MKTVYLLTHIWSDFEVHRETIGVYETRELAEKASEKYVVSDSYFIDADSEMIIKEVPMNHFIWEVDSNGSISRW